MGYDIPQILERIDLVQLVTRDLGELRKRGADHWAPCPFHTENTASFKVNENSHRYHCFGCGADGDAIDWFEHYHNQEKPIDAAADHAGIIDRGFKPLVPKRRGSITRPNLRDPAAPLTKFERDHAELFNHGLAEPPVEFEQWIGSRGWSERAWRQLWLDHHIGWNQGSLVFVYTHGIKTRMNPSDSHSTRWGFKDRDGKWHPCGEAKHNLWRQEFLTSQKVSDVFLIEGETDLMTLLDNRPERRNEVYCGVPGASWTPDPIMAYKIAHGRRVYIAQDNDKAGRELIERVVPVLKSESPTEVLSLNWPAIGAGEKADLSDIRNYLQNDFDKLWLTV